MAITSQALENSSEHVDLTAIVRTCTTLALSKESRDNAMKLLFEFDDLEVVKELGCTLSSDDSTVRRLAVSTLVSVVESRENLRDTVVLSIVRFLCSRLSDWASVEPSVRGIKLIYEKFVDSESIIHFDVGDSDSVSKLRADLSLFLGLANVSDLPCGAGTLTEHVLHVLLVNVHAPSFGQSVRFEVLQLLHIWITRFRGHLKGIEETLIRGLSIQGEDERDPDCLALFFDCIQSLFLHHYLETLSGEKSIESLFDAVKSYFPINVVGDHSPGNLTNLRESLKKCLVRFGIHSLEFLFPLLHDPSSGSQAHEIVCALAAEYPTDTLSFLSNEAAPFVDVWNAALSSLPTNTSSCILVRLAQERPDLVTGICVTFPNYFHLIADEISPQLCAQIFTANRQTVFENLNRVSSRTIESIAAILLDMDQTESIHGLVSFITNPDLLTQLIEISPTSPLLLLALCRHHFLAVVSWIEATSPAISVAQTLWTIAPGEIRPQLIVQFESYFADSAQFVSLVTQENMSTISAWIENPQNQGFPAWVYRHCDKLDMTTLSPKAMGMVVNELAEKDVEIAFEQLSKVFAVCKAVVGYIDNLELILRVVGSEVTETFHQLNEIESVSLKTLSLEKFFSCVWDMMVGELLNEIDNPQVWGAVTAKLLESQHMGEVIRVVSSADHSFTWERADSLVTVSSDRSWLPFLIANLMVREDFLMLIIRLAVELIDPKMFMDTVKELRQSRSIFKISNDVYHFKFLAKYMLLDSGTVWAQGELVDMICSSCELMEDKSVIVRFAAGQLLAVMTEIVPTGKLVSFKPDVIRAIQDRLDREKKMVVRRQLAVAITSWINVTS